MKNVLYGFLFLCLMVFCLQGCQTEEGYQDSVTGEVFTFQEFEELAAEKKEGFVPVRYQVIKPDIVDTGDASVESTNEIIQIVRPFIPEPYATGGVLIAGLVAGVWELLSRKKIVKNSDRIKLGAEITKRSIDTVVRGGTLWKEFKVVQNAGAAHTDAIMPDKIPG